MNGDFYGALVSDAAKGIALLAAVVFFVGIVVGGLLAWWLL